MKMWVSNNIYLPAMIEKNLDAKDYFIFDWLIALKESGKMVMKNIYFKERKQYLDAYYVKYDGLIKDLGSFIDISCNEVIGRRFAKYEKKGLIYKTLLKQFGTYVYIHFIDEEWAKLYPGKSTKQSTQKSANTNGSVGSGTDAKVDTNNSLANNSEAITTTENSYRLFKEVFGDLTNEFDKGFFKKLGPFLSVTFREDILVREYFQFVKEYSTKNVKTQEGLSGYVYQTFFLESIVNKFRNSKTVPLKHKKIKEPIICSACGGEYDEGDYCPYCELRRVDCGDKEKIYFHKNYFSLREAEKDYYKTQISNVSKEYWEKYKKALPESEMKKIQIKFGLLEN